MTLDEHYRLADGVAIRPERFGGLAYHYHKRQLYLIHGRELAEFVRGLIGTAPLAEAIEEFRSSRGLTALMVEQMVKSLVALEKVGVLVPARR